MASKLFTKTWRWIPSALAIIAGVLGAADIWYETGIANSLLKGRESNIFGALASAFGTLLGICFAVTAIIIALADKQSMDRFAETTDYADIGPMMARANAGLALSALLSLTLIICEGHAIFEPLMVVFLGVGSFAAAIVAMVIGRFNSMLKFVAKRHNAEATERAKEHSKKMESKLPGEFDNLDEA